METLYRKVSVNERNPNDSGYYFGIDSLGNREYPYFDKDENKWESIWETVYWLEEITDTSHQIEKLEAEKKELLEALESFPKYFLTKAGHQVKKHKTQKSFDGTPRYFVNPNSPNNTYSIEGCISSGFKPIYPKNISNENTSRN